MIETLRHDKKVLARGGFAYATYRYFDRLPLNLALKYLENAASDRNREIRVATIYAVKENFRRIPRQKSLEFILQGLEDRAAYVRLEAVGCVMNHIEELPEKIIRIALKRCEELCKYSGWFISYFASITYNVLRERAKKQRFIEIDSQ